MRRRQWRPREAQQWLAELRQVRLCHESEYNETDGLRVFWDANDPDDTKGGWCCTIDCEGGLDGIILRVRLGSYGLERIELLRVDIGSESLTDIRSYDALRKIQLRQDNHICDLALGDDTEQRIKSSKAFARRLESTVSKMPAQWFSYRNFAFDTLVPGAPRTVVFDDGFTWKFTKWLVSPEYYGAKPGKKAQKSDSSQPLTQRQKRAFKKESKQERRAKRRAQRAGQSSSDMPIDSKESEDFFAADLTAIAEGEGDA